MLLNVVSTTKVREDISTNSVVYDAFFPPRHRADSATLLNPVLDARYTVIKHNSSYIQIIKHNKGTQLAPYRFQAEASKTQKDLCFITRQHDWEAKRLRVQYSVLKKDGKYEIAISDEERARLEGMKGFTEAQREKDYALALDAGAFFLEWVMIDAKAEELVDQEEWVFVDDD